MGTSTAADARAALEAYLRRHDTTYLADDVAFVDMNSGQRAVGREAVQAMLDWVYTVAFDGRFEPSSTTIGEERAVVEGAIVGRHIGEFAGVPATGLDVRIPTAIAYRFADGRIAEANIYAAVGAFLAQVSQPASA